VGRMQGKTAVVTGAASGIGAAVASLVVAEGGQVVIADLQDEAGTRLADRLGDAARFHRCDVTLEEDLAATIDMAVETFGRLDVMVNNAGVVGAIGSIAETSLADWNRTIAILLTGVFLGTKHAARVMIPQGSGAIVSVASTAGVTGGLGPHTYTAAKHGVVGLTKSAASELAQHRIRVNAVAPGNTVTEMTTYLIAGNHEERSVAESKIAAGSPLGIAGHPDDPAHAILFLTSDEARYVTGQTLVVDAGQTSAGSIPQFHGSEPGFMTARGLVRSGS
jgi:NAD(P)-dependent dehydrogenase (short-subunit alcohol dehydrogenase family)